MAGKKKVYTDGNGDKYTLEDEVFTVHVKRPSHVGKQEMRDYVANALQDYRHSDDGPYSTQLHSPMDVAKFTVRKPPFQGERAKEGVKPVQTAVVRGSHKTGIRRYGPHVPGQNVR